MLPEEIIIRAVTRAYSVTDDKHYDQIYNGERYKSKMNDKTLETFILSMKIEILRLYGKVILTDKDFTHIVQSCYKETHKKDGQFWKGRYYKEIYGPSTLSNLIGCIRDAIGLFTPALLLNEEKQGIHYREPCCVTSVGG